MIYNIIGLKKASCKVQTPTASACGGWGGKKKVFLSLVGKEAVNMKHHHRLMFIIGRN